jgi:hypothetical protein
LVEEEVGRWHSGDRINGLKRDWFAFGPGFGSMPTRRGAGGKSTASSTMNGSINKSNIFSKCLSRDVLWGIAQSSSIDA